MSPAWRSHEASVIVNDSPLALGAVGVFGGGCDGDLIRHPARSW